MTLLHQAAQKAVEQVPRYSWDQDMDVLAGPYPDGEWVRHADVVAALQQQPEPVACRQIEESGYPFLRCGCGATYPCSQHMPLSASPSTTRQQEVGSAPEGFRLLPVEATDAMMYADWDVTMSDAHSNGGVSAAAWRAMVEAAPQVTYGNGHSGVGWYMHDTDYPEEGAVFLGAAAPSTPEKAGGVSDGVGPLGEGQR